MKILRLKAIKKNDITSFSTGSESVIGNNHPFSFEKKYKYLV